MLNFENEIYLYALLIIPIIILLLYALHYRKKKQLSEFGNEALIHRMMPDFSMRRIQIKTFLYLLALAFVLIGLANLQEGTKLEKVKREGIDVMIALDVSKSMLAEDIQPSRIDKSKKLVSELIESLSNDRVGIIIFAGNAYLQLPLTVDYAAAKLFLQTITTDIVPRQGTAIGQAIELATSAFDQEELKYKALIIITDGENHEDDAVLAAERATEQGIMIHTIGVGSEEGAPVPVIENGRRNGYKTDRAGNVVMSKLNQDMLDNLAQAGNGQYFSVRGAKNEINIIIDAIDQMEKKEFEERIFSDYEDRFQYFIAIALFLMLIEFFISEKRRGWFRNTSLFKNE